MRKQLFALEKKTIPVSIGKSPQISVLILGSNSTRQNSRRSVVKALMRKTQGAAGEKRALKRRCWSLRSLLSLRPFGRCIAVYRLVLWTSLIERGFGACEQSRPLLSHSRSSFWGFLLFIGTTHSVNYTCPRRSCEKTPGKPKWPASSVRDTWQNGNGREPRGIRAVVTFGFTVNKSS